MELTQIEESTVALKEPISEPVPEVKQYAVDPILLGVVLALTAFGVVMVYSASAVYATQKFGSATYFLRRDLLWCALGLLAMTFSMRTDFSAYRKYAYPFLGIAVVLLGAVLIFGGIGEIGAGDLSGAIAGAQSREGEVVHHRFRAAYAGRRNHDEAAAQAAEPRQRGDLRDGDADHSLRRGRARFVHRDRGARGRAGRLSNHRRHAVSSAPNAGVSRSLAISI